MVSEIFEQPLNGWLRGKDEKPLIVLSSRIRLARNLSEYPFVAAGDEAALQKIEAGMCRVIDGLKKVEHKNFTVVDMAQISELEREILVEKHLISPNFAEPKSYRSLLLSDDASVSIMVNEEDHLRIQVMEAGLALDKAWQRAATLDDALEEKLNYAFDANLGYLTACPTNVGTGLRVSVMLHLPGLALTKKLERLLRSLVQVGYSVRGLYGEGSDALGHIYQVSNQVTMGISEEETVTQLQQVIRKLIEEEIRARHILQEDRKVELEDRVWRAFGTLKYARRLNSNEALSLLSDVQLGIDVGILPITVPDFFQSLLVITRPHFLEKYVKKEGMTPSERDSARADVVRSMLS